MSAGPAGALVEDCSDVDPYDRILRKAAQDPRLPVKALGTLVFLKSKPPGWETSAEKIAAERKRQALEQYGPEAAKGVDGRDAIAAALAVLERYGYLFRRRIQWGPNAGEHHDAGTWGWVWMHSDNPESLAVRAETRLAQMRRSGVILRVAGEHRDDIRTAPPSPDNPVTVTGPEKPQVTPTTGFPSSADPSSGDPYSENPSSQRTEIREEIPPPPPSSPASIGAGHQAPPTPGKPGESNSANDPNDTCAEHGSGCHLRACGRSRRQRSTAAKAATRVSSREAGVQAQISGREARALARERAATAGGADRQRALELARAAGRRATAG